jgi:group II intron reverse transcriptase/maturase
MLSDITIKAFTGIQKCSKKGEHKVRNLFQILTKNLDIWITGYTKIYSNKGAMTKGVDDSTIDGFAEDRVLNLIELLKQGRYYPKPSRRTYIPKSNGKKRPLGMPNGCDKLTQVVWKIMLEQVFEGVFVDQSHGFRSKKSCHTAIANIESWTGTKWFVEFDIKGFFDNIDHDVLISILENKIDDPKFIRVIKLMLKAGYIENWKYNKTYSGTPQGGIISPILANIYLNELDKYVLSLDYNQGKVRAKNPEYSTIQNKKCWLKKRINECNNEETRGELIDKYKQLGIQQRAISSKDTHDPKFRRLRYARYADNFLLGIIGPKDDALEIQQKIESFLTENLKLEVSREKTGVKHAKGEGTRFLGYDLKVSDKQRLRKKSALCKGKWRSGANIIQPSIPRYRMVRFCKEKGYGNYESNDYTYKAALMNVSDIEILLQYNAELRGIANYYSLAKKGRQRLARLFYMGEYSLYKTFANKYKTSPTKVIKRLRKGKDIVITAMNKSGPKDHRLVRITDFRASKSISNDVKVDLYPNLKPYMGMTELERRITANSCEICGKYDGYFEVHYVKKVKDLKDGKQSWEKYMISRRRKTLILCIECHDLLHAGILPDWRFKDYRAESVVH